MSPDLAARLDTYKALLTTWNARINLVAPGDLASLDRRHLSDSLQLLPLLPPAGVAADLGSGAGLPGLILAAAEPQRAWHLVESDRRKAAFLVEATRAMDLRNVTIHTARIESTSLPPLAVLTARALAPLTQLLVYAERFLGRDGVALFPKGRNAEAELTEALHGWRLRVERHPSATDPAATILRLSEIARAGA
ncbi:16S rRNA (guanine(527)-N(7))-methyltransferase RsmG [Plastoroseomonas arctica]|uniref:16S rRNA (guanine(527)-N(7))-methyltransferase RsmG n=1 Tax=Plastoroseomonas arctica TaxID=1509237 RepID=UPI003462E0FE